MIFPCLQISADLLNQFIETEYSIVECEKKFLADNFHAKAEQLDYLEQMIHLLTVAKIETQKEA